MVNEVKFTMAMEGGTVVVANLDQVGNKLIDVNTKLKDAGRGAEAFGGSIGTVGNQLRGFDSSVNTTKGSVDSLAHGLKSAFIGSSVAVGLIGLKNTMMEFTQSMVQAQIQVYQLRNGLNFAVGRDKSAGELNFIRESTKALGLEFVSTSQQYMKLAASARGTSLEGQKVREVFTAVAQASTVMGLSAEQTSGALLSISQMISKNTIMSEELKGQLGERLPGAFQTAARAMGVTTERLNKMLETGQVVAGDFLPKFAAELSKGVAPEVEAAAKSMQASVNKMSYAWTDLKQTLAQSGVGDYIGKEIRSVTAFLNDLKFTLESFKKSAPEALGGLYVEFAKLAARTSFNVLTTSANSFNWALNTLTLNTLKLNENISLMPNTLQSRAVQAEMLSVNLTKAEAELANLQTRLAKAPENIYLKSETYQAHLLVKQLEAALVAKHALSGKSGISGNVPNPDRVIDRENARVAAEKQAAADKYLLSIRQQLSGVDASYLPTLEKLNAMRMAGNVSEAEYIKLVSDLAAKNYKAAASVKAHKDAKKELKDYDAHVHEFTKGNLKAIEDAEKANAKALAEVTKEHEKYIGTLEKSADTIAAQVLKLQDEEAASIIAASQYISLAQAIEQVTIARLQSQADQLSLNGNDAGASAIQREIDDRKKLIGLIGGKEAREATAKSAKEAASEWQKTADKINDSITDALMRGFESGKGFAENLRDTLTNMFKTMVLRPTISAIVNPVAQGITGMMGLAGNTQAGQGGSALDAAGSIMNAGSLLGGGGMAGSLMAGAGWMTGATTFGGALSAGASLVGTGTLAGGLSGLGMIAGALGPIALGVAALSMIGNKDKATSNTGNASANYDASGNRTGYQTYYGGSSEGVDKMLADLQTSYAVTAKALGIITAATEFSYGGNTGKNGESPNFALTGGAGGSKFVQGETTSSDAAIALAASRAVFAALQGSELPAYLSSVFNGLSAGAMTQEQITNTLAYAGSIKQVREALLETREPMAILQANVDQAFSTLATTSESFKTDFVSAIDGGISPEKLAQWQSLQVAMTELASLAEKEATAKEAAAQKVREAVQREVDKEIATVTTWTQKLAVLQGTVTERQLAMQADLATTSNAATQELIKQVYAQEDLKAATQTAKDSLKTLSESLKSLSSNVAGAQSSIADLQLQAQIDAANTANAAAEKFRGLNKSLREFLDGETLAPSASFGKLLAKAMGGDADAMQALPGAATASIEFAKNRAATSTEFALQKAGILTQVAQAANAAALLAAQTVAVPQAADPMAQAVAALETAVRELRDGIAQSISVDLVNRMGEIDTNLSGSIDRLEFGQYFEGLASDSTLQSIYGQLDVNGDGQITQLEAIRLATEGTLAEMRLSGSGGIVSGAGTYTGTQTLRAISAAYAAGQTTAQIINAANVNLGVSSAALAPVAAAGGYTEISAYQQRIDATAALSAADVATVQAEAYRRAAANSTSAEAEFVKYLVAQGWNAGMGDKAMGWPLGTTNAWATANGFPAFEVGTNYVPRDMLAQIHEGEAIIPKAYNPAAGGNGRDMARLEALVERLTKEVEGLRTEARATASNTGKTARALDGVIHGEDSINTVAA